MAVPGRFVGRAAELAALTEALDRALAGRATAVLVAGEAGIGKTRLLEELERFAGARSVPVLWGRATTEEGAPPYWPWRQALQAWLAATDSTAAHDIVGDDARDVSRIMPELATTGVDIRSVPDDPAARFVSFEATARLVRRLAEGEGLVLVLDDLHWADPASLRLLAHVVRNVRDARLLVAGALRPAEATRSATTAEVVEAIGGEPATIRLDLAGLAPDEVAAQLTPVLGSAPDPATVAAVCERTAGNPLFVHEVGRLIAIGEHGVPAAVRAVIGRRLSLLTSGTAAALAAAAVVGVEIDAGLVAAIAGLDVETVMGHLDEAVATGLATAPRSTRGYRFAHDLVRECCLLEVSGVERARLHLATAAALGERGDDKLAEIAHHRHAALPIGDPGSARDAAVNAAGQAMRQVAYDEAARFYRWAIAAADTACTDQRELARLHADLARAAHLAHDGRAAMEAAETAVRLALRVGDADVVAHAVLALEDTSEPEWLTKVAAWCGAALALLPDTDDPVRARLLAQQAVASMLSGDLDSMQAASVNALDVAERCDDDEALATALRARQLAASWPDGAGERLALGDRMLALGARTADPRTTSWGHLWRFDALLQLGLIDAAEAELARLEPVVAAARQPLARFHLLRGRTALHAALGRFDAALAADGEALDLAERGGYPGAVITSRAVRTWLSVLTGRRLVEPAELPLGDAPPVFAAIARSILAELHLAFGELEDAARLYGEIRATPPPLLPFLQITFDATMVQLAAAFGDRAAAEAGYQRLVPYADLHATGWAGAIATRGSVEHYLGVAALGAGRRDAAIDHLRRAVDANATARLLPAVAESQCVLAETLAGRARPGDDDAARAAARAADAIADELGMAFVQTRSTTVLARIGATTDPLSRRERESHRSSPRV